RGLDAGCGVEVAAHGLDLLGDLTRGPAFRTLERHVLEQVRDAVLVLALVAATAAGPHAERGGLQVRHIIGDHGQTGLQTRDFDTHAAAPSCASPPFAPSERADADEAGAAARLNDRM